MKVIDAFSFFNEFDMWKEVFPGSKINTDIEEAEKLYLSSIDNGNIEALINLANLYLFI